MNWFSKVLAKVDDRPVREPTPSKAGGWFSNLEHRVGDLERELEDLRMRVWYPDKEAVLRGIKEYNLALAEPCPGEPRPGESDRYRERDYKRLKYLLVHARYKGWLDDCKEDTK